MFVKIKQYFQRKFERFSDWINQSRGVRLFDSDIHTHSHSHSHSHQEEGDQVDVNFDNQTSTGTYQSKDHIVTVNTINTANTANNELQHNHTNTSQELVIHNNADPNNNSSTRGIVVEPENEFVPISGKPLPSDTFILTWVALQMLNWDIIFLLGGGFALSKGFQESGLSRLITERVREASGELSVTSEE